MAIDPNVPGMAAVRFNSPFEVLGQMQDLRLRQQAIRSNQALEESRRQDIAKQARDEEAQQTFLKVLSESPDPVQAAERIRVQAPSYFQAYSKALTEQQAKAEEMRKTKIEAAKVQAEVQQKAFDYGAPLMQFVEQAKFDPGAFAFAMRTWAHDFPDFQPTAEALLQRVQQGGPEEIQRIVTGFKTTQQQQADTARGTAQAELPGKVAQSAMQGQIAANMQGGITAEQRATNALRGREVRATEQRLSQEEAAPTLSPEALKLTAHQFAMTGQLPPMGMGKTGAAVRTKIINEAAEIYKNLDLPSQVAAYKANQQSLVKVQGQRDAITAFEQTALKNLDQFLTTAKNVVDTGSPIVNKPLRSLAGQVFGSAEMAAYNTARQTVVPEFAKLLSNPSLTGQLTDSQRKEIETILGPDATLKQIYASAAILKADAANRRSSLDDQISEIKGRIATPPKGVTAASDTMTIRNLKTGKRAQGPRGPVPAGWEEVQ
jgi:hypothetical protein